MRHFWDRFSWQDLSVTLPAYIGPLDSRVVQALSSNILWRGPVRIPEHKTKSNPTPPALTLNGFTLSLGEEESCPLNLSHAVGISLDHTHHPSHLELVQVVDVRDVPPIWFSPLVVKLYPSVL